MRRDDYTGYATYDWWRRLSIWKRISPVCIIQTNEDEFIHDHRRYVFVVIPNATNTSLVWTFGLHGNAWWGSENMRSCYIIPHSMFWIPGMREIMLASGAVSDRGKLPGQGLEDVVVDLISRGRSVAYCPTGMMDALTVERIDVIETRQPCLALFRAAIEHKFHIVPVLCDGENDRRYIFITGKWIRCVQKWFLYYTGYPWPLIFFPDWSSPYTDEDNEEDLEAQYGDYHRQIDVQLGDALNPVDHTDPEMMQRAFFQTIQDMTCETKEVVFKV